MSCIAVTNKLERCKNNPNEHSFFCSIHKKKLYPINKFHLIHNGNIDKILEENIIKTSKETKSGTLYELRKMGKPPKKKQFSQVFFQLLFPKGYTLDRYSSYRKEDKNIELDIKIIERLIKIPNFKAHFSNGFSFGMCNEAYCVEYDDSKSLKENLNNMYNFWILSRIEVYKKYSKTMKELKDLVFNESEDFPNEFVTNMSVPLTIDNKNYIKKIF